MIQVHVSVMDVEVRLLSGALSTVFELCFFCALSIQRAASSECEVSLEAESCLTTFHEKDAILVIEAPAVLRLLDRRQYRCA